MRQAYQFVGTSTHTLELDPSEYRGMSTPQITREVKKLLAGIAPGVSFFPEDIAQAVHELAAE